MSCFNANDAKTSALLDELKDKFRVNIQSDYTLLTVFNYNDSNIQLEKIINKREIAIVKVTQTERCLHCN